ncbi:hypothetical protein GCM10011380_06580 [Sphingomonas metalli]|uniref:DUF1345 domain-containing protein n=1 Tax=Sphingomonas metalli TaxID=1779358 RepID=A0A916WQB6_9SPHN|nr:DUF1345 domain-containing protein [Sphingomonas metalli]GGB19704.1 hypothetical protein GCM10011380_06580 [Sphingomonas metalli]
MTDFRRTLGTRVAPPRFLLFLAVLAAGLGWAVPALGRDRGIMAAFDVAALVFLAAVAPLVAAKPERMRHTARQNDANRAVLLAFSGVTLLVILAAVAGELGGRGNHAATALAVATLVLAWLFSNTVYALHYAHLFYMPGMGGDAAGLDFPDTIEPDYWDFLYFSLTLGMTFQTSDVTIRSGRMRRVVTGQCMAAFVFNLGVLAFSVNILGSGG